VSTTNKNNPNATFTDTRYHTKITLKLTLESELPTERIAFGPQLVCRAHSFNMPPVVIDPTVNKLGDTLSSTTILNNNDVQPNDIVITYLNYKGIIKTFTLINPEDTYENVFHSQI
jgi:hypothetical protein